jgi:hypothetical protein
VNSLSHEAVLRTGAHVAFVADEADFMVANLLTSQIHVLSGTGADIWELIDGSSSVAELAQKLASTHVGAEIDEVTGQLAAFLEELTAAGLVEEV